MRQLYTAILLLSSLCIVAQDFNQTLFGQLDTSDLETGILFNSFTSFSNIHKEQADTFNSLQFKQAVNELALGDFDRRIDPDKWSENMANIVNASGVKFGLLYVDFEIISDEAIDSDKLFQTPQGLKRTGVSGPIFEKRSKLIAAPLHQVVVGQNLSVDFKDEHFLNLSSKQITQIKVDFGNGEGLENFQPGILKQVFYPNPGKKDWIVEIKLHDGETIRSYSSIIVKASPSDSSRDSEGNCVTFESTIAPDLSGYGESNLVGTGQYQIFLDTVDGILDNPIILVDGFDPGDGNDIQGIYDLFNYTGPMGLQNLADELRSQGLDVVILNFPVYERPSDMVIIDGGADFVERNAMLLVELINIINNTKVGDEENVIIGRSLGGLTTRFALNYMENQGLEHETRLFLSFDSPHRGANIPIGIQHHLNYLAFGLGANNVVELQPIINELLQSAAARQMLVDHLTGHLIGGVGVDFDPSKLTPEPHPWRSVFENNINSLTPNGFPQNVRLVSIINGSGINATYPDKMGNPILPGFTLIDETFEVAFLTFLTSEINFTPSIGAGVSQISKIFLTAFSVPVVDVTANAQAFSFSDGVDAGSGGLFDLSGLTGNVTPGSLSEEFVNAFQADFFNFIPSVSGMALEITNGEIDWYHDIDIGEGMPPGQANHAVLNNTPFINWIMPDANEQHVQLTEANVSFALSEIIPETLGVVDEEQINIGLLSNPISDQLVLKSDQFIPNAQLRITDMTGKVVYDKKFDLSNGLNYFSLDLSDGIYLLNLNTEEGRFKSKLLINR